MDFKIKFRPLRAEDARFINDLRNMDDMERMLGGSLRPVSFERDLKWVQDLMLNDNQSTVFFVITPEDSNDIIGYTSITDINFRNGTCFWGGIKISTDYAGKGLGKQAALKVLKYAFEELRMERCRAECLENHDIALKMMLYAGYQKEGLMRRSVFKNGIHNNQWLLSVTSEDYEVIQKKFDL